MGRHGSADNRTRNTANGLMPLKSARTTFSYMDHAKGIPVLCVHCSGGTHRQWLRYAEALPEAYRVLSPDLHGHGGTPPPDPIQATFSRDVEMVRTLAEALDGPLHLVGHSCGGFVALQAALALQGKLLSLALIEPVAFHLLQLDPGQAAWEEIQQVASRQMTLADQGDLVRSAAEFMAYWTGTSVEESLEQRSMPYIARCMPSVASIWDSTFHQPYAPEDYARLPFPILLVKGEKTTLAAKRIVELLDEAMTNHRFVEIPDAGHMAPLTHADAVLAALHDHLDHASAGVGGGKTVVTSTFSLQARDAPIEDPTE